MNKKNLILGGVLLVLLVLAFIYNGPLKEWQDKKGKTESFLTSLDTGKINRIELNGPSLSKVFVKNGDKWQEEGVKNSPLSSEAIETSIGVLKTAKDADFTLVSEIKDKQAELETNDEKGYKLKLKNGEEILKEFTIGKNTTDFKGTYVTEVGSSKTYSVNANLKSAFGHNDWYDKTIFTAGDNDIKKIRFQYPSREFTVEKNAEGVWAGSLPYKFEVNQEKFNEIVAVMSGLQATEIPKQSFEGTGLEKNLIIVEASGDNFSRVLMVGEDNDNDLYYAKKGDSDNIYLISKEQRDLLDKRISDLR